VPQGYIFAGREMKFEGYKNLAVFRLGTGYRLHLSNGWDITPVFAFDHKIEISSFALGIL
jgi:hypothetical protein